VNEADRGAEHSGLTPSEVVVLLGDRFVEAAGMLGYKEEVLTSGVKVNTEKLARPVLQAALLANQERGAFRLELERRKAMFGLLSREVVVARPGAASAPWPEGSLEGTLAGLAGSGPVDVYEMVTRLLGKDRDDPSGTVIGMVKAGLAGRGLLEVEEKKALMVFTTASFALPPGTRALAEAAPVGRVKESLESFQREHPQLQAALEKAIRSAITFRTKSND
jgi:hypothetical protein